MFPLLLILYILVRVAHWQNLRTLLTVFRNNGVKARLRVRFLSRLLDAIFVAPKLQQVSKNVRNPCDIAATNRTENRTWFTRAILKLQL